MKKLEGLFIKGLPISQRDGAVGHLFSYGNEIIYIPLVYILRWMIEVLDNPIGTLRA